MLINVESDALFIGERLKEIDQSYYLVFNTIKNKYEVHSTAQVGCSYCLTCPDFLDERLIELTRKTRRENLKDLLDEIEKQNDYILKQQMLQQKQNVEENL